jgi:hypothetical protein
MERNSPYKNLSRRQEKNLLKATEAALRSEFQSPERTGCPGSTALSLLARRRSSMAESADLVDHIGTCSPCFAEYSQYRTAHEQRVWAFSTLGCVAAAILLYVGSSLVFSGWSGEPSSKEVARSPGQPTNLVLDLRHKGVTRGATPEPQENDAVPRLPKSKLALSIYLPIGSEEGTYEVALFSSTGEPLSGAGGEARLESFIVILPVELDLANLAPGPYELRVRRIGTLWNTYSVLLE